MAVNTAAIIQNMANVNEKVTASHFLCVRNCREEGTILIGRQPFPLKTIIHIRRIIQTANMIVIWISSIRLAKSNSFII